MRVRLVFWLSNRGVTIPFHHQYLINNWLRSLLEEMNLTLEDGHNLTYSSIKGHTRIAPHGLVYLSSKITIVVASGNVELLTKIVEGVFEHEAFDLGGMILSPESVVIENPPTFGRSARYVCLSPFVLQKASYDPTSRMFLDPTSEQFSDLLYESTMRRMLESGQYNLDQLDDFSQFQLVPDLEYLNKVRNEHKKFARIYSLDGSEEEGKDVRGYTMPFTLHAAEEVHRFLFHNGIGEHTLSGFGLTDDAESPFQVRVAPFPLKEKATATDNASSLFKPRQKISD